MHPELPRRHGLRRGKAGDQARQHVIGHGDEDEVDVARHLVRHDDRDAGKQGLGPQSRQVGDRGDGRHRMPRAGQRGTEDGTGTARADDPRAQSRRQRHASSVDARVCEDQVVPDLLIAIGAAAGLAHDRVLDLGPFHPSGQGAWQLAASTDAAGRITALEPRLGLVHRSDEKLFASRDYRQLVMMAGRHAWLASLHGELVVALAIEEAMGITPSAHTTWSRMALAELDRLQALLLLADTAPARQWRERALDLMEAATGNRVHPMAMRIGGIGQPIDVATQDALLALCDELPVDAIADEVRAIAAEHAGVGVLDTATARAYGASGSVGRASGIDGDVRRDHPYLAYAELPPAVGVGLAGDVPARFEALLASLADGVRLLRGSLAQVRAHAGEPIAVTLPKTVKVPVGTTLASVESPLGRLTAMLVADGDRVPCRVALRTPSYAHLQAMARAAVGSTLDELDPIVRSFMIAIGEVER